MDASDVDAGSASSLSVAVAAGAASANELERVTSTTSGCRSNRSRSGAAAGSHDHSRRRPVCGTFRGRSGDLRTVAGPTRNENQRGRRDGDNSQRPGADEPSGGRCRAGAPSKREQPSCHVDRRLHPFLSRRRHRPATTSSNIDER